jgi:hypothetical protein
MINKYHQVKAIAPIVSPIIDEPVNQPAVSIVNTYTKSFEENGVLVWYLYLVNYDEQVFKYRLDIYDNSNS